METAEEYFYKKYSKQITARNHPAYNVAPIVFFELMQEFSDQQNKSLLSKIEQLEKEREDKDLNIEALQDVVRDKTIERDKAIKSGLNALTELQTEHFKLQSDLSNANKTIEEMKLDIDIIRLNFSQWQKDEIKDGALSWHIHNALLRLAKNLKTQTQEPSDLSTSSLKKDI